MLDDDSDGAAVPQAFTDGQLAGVEERLAYIARRRFGFRNGVADDLARASVATYAEQRGRYAGRPDHSKILIGLLRGRCREHIRRQICLTAQRNAARDLKPRFDLPAALEAGVLDDLASRDARKLILEAFSRLRPRAREALQAIRDGATRIDLLDVVQGLGFHAQSDAASLRAYRTEFRRILAQCGIRL